MFSRSFQLCILCILLSCKSNSNGKIQEPTDKILNSNKSSLHASMQAYGQSTIHTDLSNFLDFQSKIKRIKQEKYADSCIITITVKNKKTNKIVSLIRFTSDFLLNDSSFMNTNVRSYITGKNKNAEILDNDYGDIVVADFNFDNLEDFAIKREEGGNGGPLYNYYIQKEDTTFIIDKFLSDTMIWFPSLFRKNKKILVTQVHANTYGVNETKYKLNTYSNTWIEVGNRFVAYKELK